VEANNAPPEIRLLPISDCQLATETDRKGSMEPELKCQNNMVVVGERAKS
jgi:hypothetical protein